MTHQEKQTQDVTDHAYRFLGYRLRTVWEMTEHLKKYCKKNQYSEECIGEVIEMLKNSCLLNDQEFITHYVQSHSLHNIKSTKEVKTALQRFGIVQKDIETWFALHKRDETQNVKVLLQKRIRSKTFTRELAQKTYAYLLRKGFTSDDIQKAFEEIATEE